MNYCPYCSTPLFKDHKVCPQCKKNLDLEMIQSLYEPKEESIVDTKISRKIWLLEHSHIIYPLIALIIGVISGAILVYLGMTVYFANQSAQYKEEIEQLQQTIAAGQSAADSKESVLLQQIEDKEKIIEIIQEQREILSRIINFTRRLATNSTITPNTTEEGAFFDRNIRYLIRQYENQFEALNAAGHESNPTYNLQTVPQLIGD
jgi:uncharacterized Zn finger protein (UPF0148 family)